MTNEKEMKNDGAPQKYDCDEYDYDGSLQQLYSCGYKGEGLATCIIYTQRDNKKLATAASYRSRHTAIYKEGQITHSLMVEEEDIVAYSISVCGIW